MKSGRRQRAAASEAAARQAVSRARSFSSVSVDSLDSNGLLSVTESERTNPRTNVGSAVYNVEIGDPMLSTVSGKNDLPVVLVRSTWTT